MSDAVVTPIIQPDPDTMRKHLELLFGGIPFGWSDGVIEIAWTDADGQIKFGATFGTDEIDEAVEKACEVNRRHMINVYVGAALRKPGTDGRGKDADFYALTAYYVDIDKGPAAKAARERYAAAPPSFVVVTGEIPDVRVQMWWMQEEPVTDPQISYAQNRGMARHFEGDGTVANPGRVMRLAGGIAWPNKPGRVTEQTRLIMPADARASYVFGEVAKHYQPTKEVWGEAGPSDQDIEIERSRTGPLGLDDRVVDGREKYMRNTIYNVFVEHCGVTGFAPSVEDLFNEGWPQYAAHVDFSRPGRGADEFRRKCATMIRRFEAGQIRSLPSVEAAIDLYNSRQYRKPVRPRHDIPAEPSPDAPEMFMAWQEIAEGDIPPRQFLYGRHYIRNFASATIAPGGVGKSMVAIAEAVAMATGQPLLGTATERRKVVYFNAEDPLDEIQRRVVAILKKYRIPQSALAGHLFIHSGRNRDVILAKGEDGEIVRQTIVDIQKFCEQHQPDVIIFDPLANMTESPETNDVFRRLGKELSSLADTCNIAIELVHHTRKLGGREAEAEDSRGGVALIGAVRSARVLNPMSKDEAEKAGLSTHIDHFRVEDGKANLTRRSDRAQWYQRESIKLDNGDAVGVAVPWTWPDPFEGITRETAAAVRHAIHAHDPKLRADPQAHDWAGHLVASTAGFAIDTPQGRQRANALIRQWIETDVLKVEIMHHPRLRREVKVLVAGPKNPLEEVNS